jgi:phenylacetate-CoA ligase
MDPREVRSQAEREQDLFSRLPEQLAHAKANTPYFAALLKDINPQEIRNREALATLAVTRKSDLIRLQNEQPPLGGLCAVPLNRLKRIFQSPGPIYEPQGQHADNFRVSRALRAAGFEAGDLVHNTFSYHFTPGAWIMESAAHAIGCCVFPAGVGQTEMQARAIAQLRATAYTGTPSFLKHILEKADELGLDVSSMTKAVVSGEALPPSLRQWFAERGLTVISAYATAELGLIAYETPQLVNGMVLDEDVIVEIVEPNGEKPMPMGEVGEVVVTLFDREYPLIRFATGDLSAFDMTSTTAPTACGRTNWRIRGWLGRADQTTKIKGMFVHPGQVAEVARKHPEVAKSRLVVSGNIGSEELVMHCEVSAESKNAALVEQIAHTVREVTKLRAQVTLEALASLPDDGRLIEDARTYD